MKKLRKQEGVSLIEMLVYIAIFSVFVVGLADFAAQLTATRLRSQAIIEVNDQGSRAVKVITQTLRGAAEVNSPTIGYSAPNLSLRTDSPATDPTVFSEDGETLYVAEGSGPDVALTNGKVSVSGLTFENLSRAGTPDIVRVSFTLTSSSTDPYAADFNVSGALRK